MKKTILLLLCLSYILQGKAELSKTVNVTTPGSILTAVGNDYVNVSNLTLTGTIDARDFKQISYYMSNLLVLDLSAVNIVAYTGTAGPMPGSNVYPINTIPKIALSPVAPNNYTAKLTSITLPTNITCIDNQAFYGCSGLATVVIPSTTITTMVSGAFYGCSNLTSINIPSSVTSLGASLFFGCSKLTTINIPSSVTSIGNAVLSGCTGLTTIYANSSTPVDLSSSTYAFSNVNKTTCTLHVPVGTKVAYQAAVVWQDFFNIVEGITEILTLKSESIEFYPNPVLNGFRIKGFEGKARIDITDLNGKVLLTKQVANNDFISVNSLPGNLYFVKIITGNETIVKKLIKE
ncbi:MAG: leucine-rich repeat domain-containing protein [Paludibacter sp.]|jgi:hypothetical protein